MASAATSAAATRRTPINCAIDSKQCQVSASLEPFVHDSNPSPLAQSHIPPRILRRETNTPGTSPPCILSQMAATPELDGHEVTPPPPDSTGDHGDHGHDRTGTSGGGTSSGGGGTGTGGGGRRTGDGGDRTCIAGLGSAGGTGGGDSGGHGGGTDSHDDDRSTPHRHRRARRVVVPCSLEHQNVAMSGLLFGNAFDFKAKTVVSRHCALFNLHNFKIHAVNRWLDNQ